MAEEEVVVTTTLVDVPKTKARVPKTGPDQKRTRSEKETELINIMKVIREEPDRVVGHQEQSSKHPEVWKFFYRLFLDGERTDYIQCTSCTDILRHLPSTNRSLLQGHQCINTEQGLSYLS